MYQILNYVTNLKQFAILKYFNISKVIMNTVQI